MTRQGKDNLSLRTLVSICSGLELLVQVCVAFTSLITTSCDSWTLYRHLCYGFFPAESTLAAQRQDDIMPSEIVNMLLLLMLNMLLCSL